MIDIFVYTNAIIWFVGGVVLLVGNLTYANYYTKIKSSSMEAFWMVYTIAVGLALFNFLIAFTVNHFAEASVPQKPSASYYGMAILAGESVIIYFVLSCMMLISGFIKLKQYFGRKRNKI
ncbi:membrane protein [Cronobacter phage vB_CsaM_GAP32]|uniref:Putative membrane protein n=1 Tax=Cronobacter phage vB_CsaM_GAP32 TaxID=1141136 RepID=K4F7C6_9CAUD|nr:membrane protein [Cronobacter phage vB_CsaM_GAP32]AFC21983.1 putative membrane protein [Cronobacter phage vB_CsaM_GAP32]